MKQQNQESLQGQFVELMQTIKERYNEAEIKHFCSLADGVMKDFNASNISFTNNTTYGN